jgi:hypothetical protein
MSNNPFQRYGLLPRCRRRFRCCFSAAIIQLLLSGEILHLHIIQVSTLAPRKHVDVELRALKVFQLIIHAYER